CKGHLTETQQGQSLCPRIFCLSSNIVVKRSKSPESTLLSTCFLQVSESVRVETEEQ
ncbi:unnamed protein product, partial [Bubo scandiacus]